MKPFASCIAALGVLLVVESLPSDPGLDMRQAGLAFAHAFDPGSTGYGLGAAVALESRDRAPAVRLLVGNSSPETPPAFSDENLNRVVQRTCVACHNDQLLTAELSLQGFDVASAADQAAIAEKMITKLRLEMMPPPGVPRPGGDTLQMVAEALEDAVDRAATADPNPGTRRFQRINRGEYERAIRDLLGLEVEGSRWLPSDTYASAYDTWSTVQGLSITVLDAYLTAAADVSRMAIGNPGATRTTTEHTVPIEISQHPWNRVEGAPYGTRGGIVVTRDFPVDGTYVFAVETALGQGTGFEDLEISVDGERVALLALPHGQSPGSAFQTATGLPLETEPVFVQAGQRQVAAAFVNKIDGLYEDRLQPHGWSFAGGEDSQSWADYGITALPHLKELNIVGPFESSGVSNPPSRERVFTCWPDSQGEERPCAESIIERLATQAYRRPVTEDDLAGLMALYEDARAEEGFEVGIRIALQAVLSSPSFFFRLEDEPAGLAPGDNYALSDVELASRLSFFLWGSTPDRVLLEVAFEGSLREPEVMERQVRRMLADPRSEALATRFAAQWLRLGRVEALHPVSHDFPDFSQDLAHAMRRETELLFEHLVREDRSFLELFTADYSFLNERLARHYGIPYTGGTEFKKVHLTDPHRHGLLGHGSVLSLTSLPNRTSPVVRGEWVMSVLLGSPPPPPPPNVPELEATGDIADGRFLTTRERMEMHRSNPSCNSCHQFIDPIGLALDNFDVVGRWRTRERLRPLDTRGTFYDGSEISTPTDLRQVLLKRPAPLVRTFTTNLLGYALGRQVEYFDQPSVRAIVDEAEANGYRMSSFILGVIESDQFRMKRVEVVADDDR